MTRAHGNAPSHQIELFRASDASLPIIKIRERDSVRTIRPPEVSNSYANRTGAQILKAFLGGELNVPTAELSAAVATLKHDFSGVPSEIVILNSRDKPTPYRLALELWLGTGC